MLCNSLESRRVLAHALENHYAILAVNADSQSSLNDCLEAARICRSPIIIETSLWQLKGRSFGAGDGVLGLARYIVNLALLAESSRYAEIPVMLHTDHIKGPETLTILGSGIRGIETVVNGLENKVFPSTVSLDASELSNEENIDMIVQLAGIADKAGTDVTIEMESAVDEGPTPPEITKLLVGSVEERYPGVVHLYAPGLGTRHGYSAEGYPEFRAEAVGENIDLMRSITGRSMGIALHGSSGLSADDLKAAVRQGVIKVNWATDSLAIRSSAAHEYYNRDQARFEKTHPHWKVTAMDNGVQEFISKAYIPKVTERIRLLGGEGQADSIKARQEGLQPA
jgi:fructose/tagatose bisphosphate aldolase